MIKTNATTMIKQTLNLNPDYQIPHCEPNLPFVGRQDGGVR